VFRRRRDPAIPQQADPRAEQCAEEIPRRCLGLCGTAALGRGRLHGTQARAPVPRAIRLFSDAEMGHAGVPESKSWNNSLRALIEQLLGPAVPLCCLAGNRSHRTLIARVPLLIGHPLPRVVARRLPCELSGFSLL
jgi:hypothetical protein